MRNSILSFKEINNLICYIYTSLKKSYILSKTRFTLFFYLFINHLLLSQYVQGLDVSNWQGSINWNEVNTDGQVYAWSKATEGMTYQERLAHCNCMTMEDRCRRADLIEVYNIMTGKSKIAP